MRAAKIENSDRLKRTLKVLKRSKSKGCTTMEIIVGANVCAVNSIISELRRNGYHIVCKREGMAWRYTLR